MRRFYAWLRAYLSLRRIYKRCAKNQKLIRRQLASKKKQLEHTRRHLGKLADSLEDNIQYAENLLVKSEREMESLRSRLKVAEDVTIPTLVEQHKLVLERSVADTAEQVRRQVQSQPLRQEE